MLPLTVIFGAIVGLSLGLTGGGGAIFAVPLLVYGLAIPARQAVTISLVAVGTTSLIGFLYRQRLGQVEVRPGLLFAAAGAMGAPIGTWVADLLPESLLMVLFAVLMVVVALRLWQHSSGAEVAVDLLPTLEQAKGPACRRDSGGALILSSRCAILLLAVGIATGVLSGLFGVGGGFVIVPALVLFSGMSMHRAVGTSLMVVSLVSVSAIAAHWWAGREISLMVTVLFILGGVAGLFAGQRIGRQLSGPRLHKVFAMMILVVAAFVLVRGPMPDAGDGEFESPPPRAPVEGRSNPPSTIPHSLDGCATAARLQPVGLCRGSDQMF